MATIAELRRTIDAKHADALKALATLGEYLDEIAPGTNGGTPKRRSPRKGTGKIRAAVLAAFSKEFLTIAKAVQVTGLTRQQIRGVVQSPVLKQLFEKRQPGEFVEYRYVGEQ